MRRRPIPRKAPRNGRGYHLEPPRRRTPDAQKKQPPQAWGGCFDIRYRRLPLPLRRRLRKRPPRSGPALTARWSG